MLSLVMISNSIFLLIQKTTSAVNHDVFSDTVKRATDKISISTVSLLGWEAGTEGAKL